FLFALLAALLSTTVSATLGVSILWLAGSAPPNDLASIWGTWWLGDLGGDLVVAPAILAWAARDRARWHLRQLPESACLLGILLFVSWEVFGGRMGLFGHNYPVDFLCLPPVLWAAYRFGRRGAALAVVLLSSVALRGTLHQFGPFARSAENETLLLLETFLGVTSVTAYVVAAAVEERRRASEDVARKLDEVASLNRRLDEQKDEIATYHNLLTHDITNFASALLGFLQRLLLQADGSLEGKQVELLRRANRQALEITRMAENARMLVRVRERGLPATLEPVDVPGALARAIQVTRDLHFDREFEVSVEGPVTPLEVSGTPFLDNILINLLDNAVRHGPRSGCPRIGIRAARVGNRLDLKVRGGTPPAPERMRGLIERGGRAPEVSPHGIGLIVIREILERSGGTLSVASGDAEGPEGKVFEVSLSLPVVGSIPGANGDRSPGAPGVSASGSETEGALKAQNPRR
ncbi:MAG TPA: MASE1 domain-containing protein, partial [Planctomycetota bacterium]|nr:MASE1 domain-containing protein [Planctomycetota bacterium]